MLAGWLCMTCGAIAEPLTRPADRSPATSPARPATIPTTTDPTTQPLDLSSPKAALRGFAAALHDGNAGRLGETLAVNGPGEEKMVLAMAEMAAALRQLHKASLAAFGPTGADKFTGDTEEQHQKNLERIDAAEVLIAGDVAAVRYPGADKPEYELKRAAGRWRVPAAQFSQGADAATLDRRMVELTAQARIVRELAVEIEANRYKNADAASDAWRAKIMQSLGIVTPSHPATGPATKPDR